MMRAGSLVLLILFLSSCSRLPLPASYALSEQQKMQAAHHWDVLAYDVANQINNRLISSDNVDKEVFVKATCGNEATPCGPGQTTQFNEGFRDLLITRLVNFGVPTSNTKRDMDIEINYKVQVIYHAARRFTTGPGVLTALSTAINVFRNAPSGLQLLALGGALDIANAAAPQNGHYEVIITTSMVTAQKYLFRTSDIYYINDPDFWHYQNVATGQTIQLVTSTR